MPDDCSKYWNLTEFLPLDTVIDYWCSDSQQCRDAKKFALIHALQNREVGYIRKDGKTFDDDIAELVGRGNILIHKESFDAWAEQFRDSDEDVPILHTKERNNLYTLIGALHEILVEKDRYVLPFDLNGKFRSTAQLIEHLQNYELPGLSIRHLEDCFRDAKKAIEQR